VGTTAGCGLLNSLPIETAPFSDRNAVNTKARVAVLTETVVENLFEGEDVLKRRDRPGESKENDFTIRSQMDIMSVYGETARGMTLLLAGMVGVSLIVGGIGNCCRWSAD